MFKKLIFAFSLFLHSLHALTIQEVDTTKPVYCTFSNKFQNRIMVENSKIRRIISSDDEKISILMDDISGQAFIFVLDPLQQTTTLSVITQDGIVQDIQIAFAERSSEVILLKEDINEKKKPSSYQENETLILQIINQILLRNIPDEYIACPVSTQTFSPKKGFCLQLISKLQSCDDTLYVYEVVNLTKNKRELFECELQFENCKWIYLDSNVFLGKQKKIAIVAVKNE